MDARNKQGEPTFRAQRRALFALCLTLARGRPTVVIGLALMAITAIVLAMVGAVLAARGRSMSATIPGVSSEVLAWVPGMLVTFAGALHALRHDAEHGVFTLVLGRGFSLRTFVLHRVFAFGALLAASSGLGVALVTAGVALRASSSELALVALHQGAAGLVHAIGFGAVMAPVALATLGARSRASGYLALVFVLALPELARLFSRELPAAWSELLSIPSCLTTLRKSLSPGHVDALRAAGALVVLAAASALATAATWHQAKRALYTRLEPA